MPQLAIFLGVDAPCDRLTLAPRRAVAKRYIPAAELAELEALLDRIRAMLYRLTR